MKIPVICKKIGKIFISHGFSCYLVGGAIRNLIAGFPVKDYDLATNASPHEVMRIFKRVIPTGIKHGTVTVLFSGKHFEVTTFRVEGTYTDSRRPDSVEYTPCIFEDLKRRDFTINAMAYNLETEELIDPHNGINDLASKIIKAIGNPTERFNEDGLRLLRACRFSSQLNFVIETATFEGLKQCKKNLRNVSMERIRDEFIKTIQAPQPSRGFRIMQETGILQVIVPEMDRCVDVEQKGFHQFDVFTHLLLSCDMAPPENLPVRIAALFHDIGKPDAKALSEDGEITFYRHEHISEIIAVNVLKRLRFPKKLIEYVARLIKHHMFHYESEWTDSAIRRFISRAGEDLIDDLIILRAADQYAMAGKLFYSPLMKEFENRIKGILEQKTALTVRDLHINGKVIQEKLRVPPGPAIGIILKELLETVLNDPSLNQEKPLLKIAENFYKQRLLKTDNSV